MSANGFPPEVLEQLGYYVYRLVDPRDGATFYVGKGTGNRVFQHAAEALGENADTLKIGRIRDIRANGASVQHVIHRHGLTEKEAFEVESPPRRAFAVHAYSGQLALDGVLFDLRHVVRHVIHNVEADRLGALTQDLLEGLADPVGDHLPIGKREVCRRGHGAEVGRALRGRERNARQLTVGKRDPVPREGATADFQIVLADLMSEPARAAVHEDGHLTRVMKAEDPRGRRIIDLFDSLNLQEVVP